MNSAMAVEAYRWLLRLYPAGFRREFGEEMAEVFEAALCDAAGSGPWAALRCAAREAAHAPWLLLNAYLNERRAGLAVGTPPGALRQEVGMTRRYQIVLYGLATLLLAMFGWWLSILQGGAAISLTTGTYVAVGGMLALALAWAARRLSPWLWAAAGLAMLAALLLPSLRPHIYGEAVADGSGLTPGRLWWVPATTLVVAAGVGGSGLHAALGPRQRGVWLGLAGLLAVGALHALYWQMLWDSQLDPRDWFWVLLPALAAATTAAVLLAALAGQRWPRAAQRALIVALALLVPGLVFGIPAMLTRAWGPLEQTPHVNQVALADLNGDGHLDALVAVGNGNMPFPAYALYNDGTGRFDQGAQPIGKWPGYAVALGDVNGDGQADALLDITAGGLVLYLNEGGAFRGHSVLAEPGPKGVMRLIPVLGDLNGDGRLDVFAAGCCGRPPGETPESVASAHQPPYSQVWLQTPEGRLRPGQRVGEAASHAAGLGDVDGDGDLDVFLANGRPLEAGWANGPAQPNQVWLNDGQGRLVDSGQRLGQGESWAVALADVNGDFWPDAVVGNTGADEVWLNDGRGRFADSGQRLGSGTTLAVFAEDLDLDGDLDLFLAGAVSGQVWLNGGGGQFGASGPGLRYATDTAVTVGDITGDGLADVLAAGPSAYRVWVNDGTGRLVDGPRGSYR